MMATPGTAQIRRHLRVVRLIALLDLVLLLALVVAAITGQRALVRVLGPVHGINFLFLLTVAATAALDGLWGWWFPTAIFLTGGPLGALIGERAVARRLASAQGEPVNADDPKPGIGADSPTGAIPATGEGRDTRREGAR